MHPAKETDYLTPETDHPALETDHLAPETDCPAPEIDCHPLKPTVRHQKGTGWPQRLTIWPQKPTIRCLRLTVQPKRLAVRSLKLPVRCKYLEQCPVIAYFVSKFVSTATKVGDDEIRLASFDSSISILDRSKTVINIKSFWYYVFWTSFARRFVLCWAFCKVLGSLKLVTSDIISWKLSY